MFSHPIRGQQKATQLTFQLAHPKCFVNIWQSLETKAGRTWVAGLTICALIVARNRMDEILERSLIPRLLAFAHH